MSAAQQPNHATLDPARVLSCVSCIPTALDWVAQNAVKPAVVSLSLGVPAGSWSKPMEDAIQHMTEVVGVPVIVASGNSAKDSCGVAPARAATALTVAASNMPAKFQQTRAGEADQPAGTQPQALWALLDEALCMYAAAATWLLAGWLAVAMLAGWLAGCSSATAVATAHDDWMCWQRCALPTQSLPLYFLLLPVRMRGSTQEGPWVKCMSEDFD